MYQTLRAPTEFIPLFPENAGFNETGLGGQHGHSDVRTLRLRQVDNVIKQRIPEWNKWQTNSWKPVYRWNSCAQIRWARKQIWMNLIPLSYSWKHPSVLLNCISKVMHCWKRVTYGQCKNNTAWYLSKRQFILSVNDRKLI